ncbi:hypothetical protein Rumeso_01462 [Rubellimicrobium mesophilum DSM 19309]|uniref:Uncharacterized protein n=1 Tax=Rubellimicrobium mesophilum DSM 19309 TaxID=442562 RepID=A0A017HRI7_9RHOB|nr:hypothetical protein [Rubellimicrobium mesophilum]EYD76940.1 hypothetical protein Rumeso_01462 [Rubellimicrobium mesophilum DSM 19309]
MICSSRKLPVEAAAEKRRILLARGLFRHLAGRVPDAARGRRLEARLNDAWLCLQLARVADDPALALAQRQAWASLLGEVLDAAEPCGSPKGERAGRTAARPAALDRVA